MSEKPSHFAPLNTKDTRISQRFYSDISTSMAQDKPYQTHAQENGLASAFNLNTSLIEPAKISDMQWKAKRPRDSSLNISKASVLLDSKPLKLNHTLEIMKKEKTEN